MPGLADPSSVPAAASVTGANATNPTAAAAANPFASLDLSSLLTQFNANASSGAETVSPVIPPSTAAPTATATAVSTATATDHVLDSGILNNPQGKYIAVF